MRAPAQEPIATSGQSLVTSQFELMGWGVIPNAFHDVGTDLVLMPRDRDLMDLTIFMGAQVKTSVNADPGTKYFSEPVKDADGEITGWWFRESKRDHFEYWLESDPHLIILVDREEAKSYWAHISETAVVWTDKGAKIFVPRQNTVDKNHLDELTAIATSGPRGPNWEGSAWTEVISAPDLARFRYALITPRLIAPHPNSSPNSIEPEQAVAMLVQCRFNELDDRRKLAKLLPGKPDSPYMSSEEAGKSPNIIWRFYAALHAYITSGNLQAFPGLIKRNTPPHILAAITAAYVAILIENIRPQEGLACLDKVRRFRRRFSLVDDAWLEMQRARCLLELGHKDLARQISIRLQALPKAARKDPTALAIAASAAIQIFTTAPWFSGEVSDAIKRTDTAAFWWRSQVVAWGLGDMLERSFEIWTAQDEAPFGLDRQVFGRLRSASLLSGFAGDHSGWRQSLGQVGTYGLQALGRNSNVEGVASLLSDLRQSGHDDELWAAARRIVSDGPASSVKQATVHIDLDRSTATTSLSDIRLLTAASDILDQGRADGIAKWALRMIRNPGPFTRRVQPSYLIEKYVLEMLSAVMPACSKATRRQVIQHLLRLPQVTDVALATFYAPVVAAIDRDDWTPKALHDLALRRGDDKPLAAAIDRTLAEHDSAVRRKLISRAARGSAQALANLGDVRKLPPRVIRAQIDEAISKIRAEIIEARRGAWAEPGAHQYVANLAILNIWHPQVANWDSILEILEEPKANPDHCGTAVQIIGNMADRIDGDTKSRLVRALEEVRTRRPFPLWAQQHQVLVRTAVAAIDALSPSEVSHENLWQLMAAGPGERGTLARIVGNRSDPSDMNLLALLAHDRNPAVRSEAARSLCRWLLSGIHEDQLLPLLLRLTNDPGTQVPLAIANELATGADIEATQVVRQNLRSHLSISVRRKAAT